MTFIRDTLTERERQVAACLALGMIAREIASQIGITKSTVKNHLTRMYLKRECTGVGSAKFIVGCIRDGTLPIAEGALEKIARGEKDA